MAKKKRSSSKTISKKKNKQMNDIRTPEMIKNMTFRVKSTKS